MGSQCGFRDRVGRGDGGGGGAAVMGNVLVEVLVSFGMGEGEGEGGDVIRVMVVLSELEGTPGEEESCG